MDNHEYCVTILNENNVISGNLQEKPECDRQTNFDPLTVLGDLLDIMTYAGMSPFPQDDYSLNEKYIQHPFFMGYDYKESPFFQKPFSSKNFFVAMNELKEIITSNSNFSMSKFEILKQFLSLEFTYKVEFIEINYLYKSGYKENPINHEIIHEYQYLPLQYTYNYNMEAIFKDKDKDAYKFIYTCHKIEDIIFSVLHYLVLFEYKFKKCEHCGKYFATDTFKVKYCTRKSPYTYSSHNISNHKSPLKVPKDYTCSDAVDLIKNRIRSKISHICYDDIPKYLDDPVQICQSFSSNKVSLKEYSSQAQRDFMNSCEPYKDEIKKQASVKNLEVFEQFLDKKKAEIHANKKRPKKLR